MWSEVQVCLLSLLLRFGHSWVSRAGIDFQSGLVWKGNEVRWKANEPQIHYGYGVHLCSPMKKVFCFYKHPQFLLGMLLPHAHTFTSHEAGWEHASSNQDSLKKGRLNPRNCAIYQKRIPEKTPVFCSRTDIGKILALVPLSDMWSWGRDPLWERVSTMKETWVQEREIRYTGII